MSPRAAWRLERLGFGEVYDFVPGKLGWFSEGMPLEGSPADEPLIGAVVSSDVPTCPPEAPIGEVAERVRASPDGLCLITNEERIVLGRVRAKDLEGMLEGGEDRPVEAVMEPDPSTFRPNVGLVEMLEYMQRHSMEAAIVTTASGRLVGLLRSDDAARILRERHRHHDA